MSDAVLFEQRGGLGLITLNRPEVLNAISHAMVGQIDRQLADWAADAGIRAVLIRGAGGKAFAAGGDIRRLYDAMGDPADDYPVHFFRDEYRLNRRIKTYPKPYIAVYNGIVMGGGVGVSVHGAHRIATDATLFAMPETGIGFFPDVGGAYFLPRLKAGLGRYLALTGGRLDGGDCVAEGLAESYMPVARLDDLIATLASAEDIPAAIAHVAEPAPAGRLKPDRSAVAVLFEQATLNDVLAALQVAGTDFAEKQLKAIRSKCPLSVAVAWEQLRRGAALDFDACLKLEYRIALQASAGTEFREGVRALIVDKDNKPAWADASIEAVSEAAVQAHFQPPATGDLTFTT